jgi:hypothetical protein
MIFSLDKYPKRRLRAFGHAKKASISARHVARRKSDP